MSNKIGLNVIGGFGGGSGNNNKKIPDAPIDGTIYGRKNGEWVKIADDSLLTRVEAIELELNGVLNDLISI